MAVQVIEKGSNKVRLVEGDDPLIIHMANENYLRIDSYKNDQENDITQRLTGFDGWVRMIPAIIDANTAFQKTDKEEVMDLYNVFIQNPWIKYYFDNESGLAEIKQIWKVTKEGPIEVITIGYVKENEIGTLDMPVNDRLAAITEFYTMLKQLLDLSVDRESLQLMGMSNPYDHSTNGNGLMIQS